MSMSADVSPRPDDQGPGAPPPGDGGDEQGADEDKALDALNILPLLMKEASEWTKKQAALVVATAKEDDDSRADYMKTYASMLKLFAGVVRKMGYPAQGADSVHLAIMTKALLHLWARVYDQVVPAKGDIVKTKPLGPKDQPRSQRVERHMNWQLRYRMPDWGVSIMFSIMGWLIAGSRFRHYRWDPIAHTHAIDDCPVEDIIVNDRERDTSPQMKNVERITRVLRLARWELEKYVADGFYSNLDSIFPDLKAGADQSPGAEDGSTSDGDMLPSQSDDDRPVTDAINKIQGTDGEVKKTKYTKREVYEQHAMLTFPKSLSVHGLAGVTKPVVFTVDKQTKKPLAVTLREIPDPVDQTRFDQEMAALKQSMVSMAQPTMAPAPAPGAPPPAAPKPPRPVRMQTVHRIIHFGLFPNPDGFYRLGVGGLLAGSNELANTLASEYMLTAKFANMITGFMALGTRTKEGDLQVTHGKINQTQLEPEMLDKAIKLIEFQQPSEGLMKVVEKLEQNAEIGPSADLLSGEKGASNETAKGMMVRNSNAMALISVITRIFLESLKYELKLVAHGNSVYLDEVEYFPFTQDIPGQPDVQQVTSEHVGRQDYVEDVHLEFTADARMISKPERISDAKDFLQLIVQTPVLQQNVPLVDYATRQVFIMAELPGYLAAMGPPPGPPPPPTPQSQDVENAGFFNEQDHPVLPDDNHMLHLHKVNELKKSPLHEHLSSTGKQMLDRHERAHVAQHYLQMQALQHETGAPVHELASAGGIGGMGPGPAGGQAPPGAGGAEAPGGEGPPGAGAGQ